jgi:hypothetical protein
MSQRIEHKPSKGTGIDVALGSRSRPGAHSLIDIVGEDAMRLAPICDRV